MSGTDRRPGVRQTPGAAPAELSSVSPVAGYQFRPIAAADADALTDLILAGRAADGQHEPVTPEELRHHWFEHPGVAARDTLAAHAADGRLVGIVAAVARDPAQQDPGSVARIFIPGVVHPAHRRRGIGTHLLRFAEERGRSLLAGTPSGLARRLMTDSPAGAADRARFLELHGYRASRTFATMRHDLAGNLESGPLPNGLRATPWEPARDDATRLAHNDAFRDHWQSDPITPERWRHYVMDAPGFSPACSWLAVAGDQVVGYTLCTLNTAPDGTTFGWLGTIGVRRGHRGRGVATALIRRSLAAMTAAGASTAGLDVDAENPTGAMRLYASIGFVPTDETIVYLKDVGN